MISIRPLEWVNDKAAVFALDTSVILDRVYQLNRKENSFVLEVVALSSPQTKRYELVEEASLTKAEWAMVALCNEAIVGLATMNYEAWNRRARLEHLYVDTIVRGQGVGRLLVESALAEAKAAGMRCLWVETQTSNAPAIEFYTHLGFTWCGFDRSLYEPARVAPGEEAIFFVRDVDLNSILP